MRNKRKDLILDFTSLLDVALILLFFFILFSRIGADTKVQAVQAEAQKSVQAAQEEAQKSKNRYDELVEENIALQNQLENNIAIVGNVTSQEAEEIISFNDGNNLKILLQSTGSISRPLVLTAILNKKVIGTCYVTDIEDSKADQENDISADRIINWLDTYNISKDSVIMCDFVYNANEPRTSEAYDKIYRIIDEIRNSYGYGHFYCSSTDLSIGVGK